ncbi:DNA/RNA non-specific endonuclease [Simplicispira metamorpha]|uniref:Endonuclease G n=1 Tax=Simplicispira metamorpha TaxID=80881 RepID=A0A4R2MQV0_9BURK|nr:DNA/RNA non-specific endonuclease [Simplicispira metamorpha]TCP10712.1 endonuclease G [Simplicispira metamorpha]
MGRAAALLIAAAIAAFQASSCSEKSSAPPAASQKHAELKTSPSPKAEPQKQSEPKTSPEPDAAPRKNLEGIQTSFKDCRNFFANGVPPIVPHQQKLRELCYDAFAILHSGVRKTPVFVAQKLNRALVADADEKRKDRFFADARLPEAERAKLSDYKNSGYSRGHMAPAGDMPTPAAMAQSFSLANMVPQVISHNSGAWKKIETDTRLYASRAIGDVYIITGPVFGERETLIKNSDVHVPTHIFKLVYDEAQNRAWAHFQENAEGVRAGEPISYEDLVQRIGMELLPSVKPAPRLPLPQ